MVGQLMRRVRPGMLAALVAACLVAAAVGVAATTATANERQAEATVVVTEDGPVRGTAVFLRSRRAVSYPRPG